MIASRHPRPEEMDAYERVLGDAMAGDATLFAREDYVEEAWRIVDPMLKAGTPVYEYDNGTLGTRARWISVAPPGRLAQPALPSGRFQRGNAPRMLEKIMKLEVLDDADSVARRALRRSPPRPVPRLPRAAVLLSR